MEDNYKEDMVLISRSNLERLEQDKNLLEVQLREERQKFKDECSKFKDSAKYSLIENEMLYSVCGTYRKAYTNDEFIYNLSMKIDGLHQKRLTLKNEIEKLKIELKSELTKIESFWNLPLYKRLFLCLKRKR